jgi:hypothetical protein
MAAQGEIGPQTLLWKSGMANWVACHQFPALPFSGQGMSSTVSASPQPYHGAATPPNSSSLPRTSGFAVASLVLGILFLCGVGSLLATVFGAVAIGQIAKSNGTLSGRGMAIAGLVLGIIGLGLLAFLFFAGTLERIAESLESRQF